jgi:hypothetical protein
MGHPDRDRSGDCTARTFVQRATGRSVAPGMPLLKTRLLYETETSPDGIIPQHGSAHGENFGGLQSRNFGLAPPPMPVLGALVLYRGRGWEYGRAVMARFYMDRVSTGTVSWISPVFDKAGALSNLMAECERAKNGEAAIETLFLRLAPFWVCTSTTCQVEIWASL